MVYVSRLQAPRALMQAVRARALWALALAAVWSALPAPVLAQELIMVDQRGCFYCARWEAEIGPAYPNTAEGRAAPLRRVDLHGPWPEEISLARRVSFTPTFVLIDDDGVEIGRLEGYPGDQFFWPMLGQVFARAGVDVTE